MPISEAAINALPLGKDVYDDLTYCMQQWQEAGYKAVMVLPPPDDPDANVDWVISLIGNMAWAATVFFPPAFEVATAAKVAQQGIRIAEEKLVFASASAATKATSMIGAGLAAGIVPQLRKLGGRLSSPDGKEFLSNYLGTQVPDILKTYAAQADAWVHKELLNRLISQYSLRSHPDPRNDNDAAFTAFYNSVAGAEERRRYVWDEFVFPDFLTPYDNKPRSDGSVQAGGQAGLQNFIARGLGAAIRDFDSQWDDYVNRREYYVAGVITMKPPRSRNSARRDFMERTPFNPTLTYKGIPSKLLEQQETNRRKLKLLMLKYGTDT
jgi:hypothetical protein